MSAQGAHRSTTALGPRPCLLSLRPVVATPEPRTKRGSCSSRLEESGPLAAGQAGACGEGSCTYLCLRCSQVWGVSQWGPTQSPTSLPSGPVLGDQASLCLRPRKCGLSRLCTFTCGRSRLGTRTYSRSRLGTRTCSRSLLRTRSRAGGGGEGRLSASGLLAGISLFYISLKCLT